jgi:hypothetical protein
VRAAAARSRREKRRPRPSRSRSTSRSSPLPCAKSGQSGWQLNRSQCEKVFVPQLSGANVVDASRYDPALARRRIEQAAHLARSCLLQDLWPKERRDTCAPLFQAADSIAHLMGVSRGTLGQACSATCSAYSCIGRQSDVSVSCLLEEGLRCAEDHTCQPARMAGDACRNEFDCANGLACTQSVCAELRATGPCIGPAQCASTSECDDGQCVPKSSVSAEFCAGEF